MEQLYTIPVNEAFEKGQEDASRGCPFCRLYRRLELNELDLILGASMMEPDVRKKTNEKGFCPDHYSKMMKRGKRLPLSLILQSHLAEVDGMLKKPGITPALAGADSAKKLKALSEDCYVCERIEANFSKMIETAAILWETDPDFKYKCSSQPYFCLPHFSRYLSAAKAQMKGKTFAEFYKSVYKKEEKVLEDLQDKIDRFAKSFDYRYAKEPWDDAKRAIEDTMPILNGTDCTDDE
ncbi:MAG: hypothetical protein E7647_06670 [Ruminococcaceae bacterium]|nr:hypothetical protein [Oscillospiraceae bacterium]